MKKCLNKNDYHKYEVILWQLNDKMNLRSNLNSCLRTRHGGCNIENRSDMMITDMIKNSDIELAVGKNLLNLVECDLILKIP